MASEELLVYEDSYRKVSFAINQGDAARTFQIDVGDRLMFKAPQAEADDERAR